MTNSRLWVLVSVAVVVATTAAAAPDTTNKLRNFAQTPAELDAVQPTNGSHFAMTGNEPVVLIFGAEPTDAMRENPVSDPTRKR